MAAASLCDACIDGDHANHHAIIQAVPEGMMGGIVCVCFGECSPDYEGEKSSFIAHIIDSMRKYADTGKVTVVTPEEHKQIEENLNKLGKKTASDLTDEERHDVLDNPKQ